MTKSNSNEKKNVVWNTLGTTINAFNSLFFMIIATRVNGMELAGIFTYAFSMSALFNIIGTYHGRVFQVTECSDFTDGDFFWNKILTCIFMLLFSLLFVCFNQYSLEKFLIICTLVIYRTLEAFAEVLYAYYQKNNDLYKVGISLVVKNLLGLLLFLAVDYFTNNLLLTSVAIMITHLIVLLFYDMEAIRLYHIAVTDANKKNVIAILKKGFYPFLLAFFIQILINIPRYIIDLKLPSNISTVWGILIMPASIMILIGQFCLSPFLMNLFDLYSHHKIKEYIKKVGYICLFVLAGGGIALIAAWFLGIPVLSFVYGIDLSDYKMSLILIIIGAILYGVQNILYNLLIAMRHIKIQIYIYFFCIIISAILFYIFIIKQGVLGACIAYAIIMLFLFLSYLGLFLFCSLRKLGDGYVKS